MEDGTEIHGSTEIESKSPGELTANKPAEEPTGEFPVKASSATADEDPAPFEYPASDEYPAADEYSDPDTPPHDGVFRRLRETVQDIITETTCGLENDLNMQLQSISDKIQSNHQELLQQMKDLRQNQTNSNNSSNNRYGVNQIPSNPSSRRVNHTESDSSSKSASKSQAARSLDRMHNNEVIRWDAYFKSPRYGPDGEDKIGTKVDDSRGVGMSNENASGEDSPRLAVIMPLPGAMPEDSQSRIAGRLSSMSRSNIVKNMSHDLSIGNEVRVPHHEYMPKMRVMTFFWCLSGVLPWDSSSYALWYQRSVKILLACASALSLSFLIQERDGAYESIGQTLVSVCTLLCLACFKEGSTLLGPSERVLLDHARAHGYLREWGMSGLIRLAFILGIWLFTIAISIMSMGPWSGKMACTIIVVRTFRNGVLLAFIHCMWQILSCLELMVDSYFVEFFENMNCERCVATWNALQALLRRTAEGVENSFLAVQVATTAALGCGAVRAVVITLRWNSKSLARGELGTSILLHTELLLMIMSGIVMFARAASVTEKCFRVPPMVNSVLLEPDKYIDEDRQYLVTFIANSHAGFYVKGTRFTFSMLARFCYLYGTVMCGLASAVFSASQKG